MTSDTHVSPSALIVLDVDGTISRIYRDEEYAQHENDRGWSQLMPFDQEVMTALDRQAKRPGVRVAWLTTWFEDGVERIVAGPLEGRLAGAYVPHVGGPDHGWRFRSLTAHLHEVRPDAVVWADDRAPSGAASRIRSKTGVPALVIKPDKHVGVTLADVKRIARYLDRHLSPEEPSSE